MTTILKTSTKGQITLPAAWRKKQKTDSFIVKSQGDSLLLTPIHIAELDEDDENWVTVFDSNRDNHGQGLPIDDFIAALDKTLA
ncbi:TPA: hypothetical protein DEP96_02125 [Candidatus Uhrbacteria bacterium]|nr:hypothetical protein [Candidatus Uhrbacteria bacterium]